MISSPINPTLQEVIQPNLKLLFDALSLKIRKQINCARPGIVTAFDAATCTATVTIAQQQVTSIQPNGAQTFAQFPPLTGVPVEFPGGGGMTLTFPVAEGDECILLFHDREIDNWYLTGQIAAPTTPRTHDFSDAIALVGLRSAPRRLAGISTTSAQMRSDDGNTIIDISSGKIQLIADEVVIHGRNKTTFDAGGTGFVYTPAQIDTYTDGVLVVDHAPHPPEVPT